MSFRSWFLSLAVAMVGSGCSQPPTPQENLPSAPARVSRQTQALPEAPLLLADLAPGTVDSNPAHFMAVGQTAFFIIPQVDYGELPELWKTDGTQAGTVRVKAIEADPIIPPVNAAVVGQTLFFFNCASEFGVELWKSDGTEAGTVRVKGAMSSNLCFGGSPPPMAVVGTTLYMLIQKQVWRSDGTEAGTVRVKDYPGSYLDELTAVGTTLYLVEYSWPAEPALWKSDGTEAGTVRMSGISGPSELTELNGILFFASNDSTAGRELWRSDGTETGTFRVKDLFPGTSGAEPRELTRVGDTLYFTADDGTSGRELWKSDGTEAGTVRVRDILPGAASPEPRELTRVGDTLYFTADDGTSGRELWKSDGTEAGTVRVRDILPGAASSMIALPTGVGDALYFTADDGLSGRELWISDGTEAGTRLVRALWPGAQGLPPRELAAFGTKLLFVASDGQSGLEPWVTDGSSQGTALLADVRPQPASSSPLEQVQVGGTLFFSASGPEVGRELWKVPAFGEAPELVKDLRAGLEDSYPGWLMDFNGTLLFVTESGLWKSDGTPTGTQLVREFDGAFHQEGRPRRMVLLGDTLIFEGNEDGITGRELWKSDGTTAGTQLIKDIRPGGGDALWTSEALTPLGDLLYFTASDGIHGLELWKTDGTEAGTQLVKDIRPGTESARPYSMTVSSGALFFVTQDSAGDDELWRSDGTEAGTVRIQDGASGFTSELTSMNGTLFFARYRRGASTSELWKSDGTEAGTVLVRGDVQGLPWSLHVLGDALYFVTQAGDRGELWRSDGTEAGTVRVAALGPSTYPMDTVVLDGLLFFTTWEGTGKLLELWRSDGTEAGTVRIAGVRVELSDTALSNLAPVGKVLYFSGDDGLTGRELWGYPLAPIRCPAPVSLEATDPEGVAHAFWPLATPAPGATGPLSVSYSHELGQRLPLGTTLVTATAFDPAYPASSCTFPVTVTASPQQNHPPVALCRDVTVSTDATCTAVTAGVDDGSYDPDEGDTLSCAQTPEGPYGAGTHPVTLTCTDGAGLSSSCEAVVTVQALGLAPPSLTLDGDEVMTLECGVDVYLDPGARAWDGCGMPLEVHRYNSGQDPYGPGPNTAAEGSYSVQYLAWDAAGQTVSALRTVHVEDRTAPLLTLLGPARMTHTCGSNWVDPGVQATDACYGDLTPAVVTVGSVNGWVEGGYTVRYEVRDSGGNVAEALERTVDVYCP